MLNSEVSYIEHDMNSNFPCFIAALVLPVIIASNFITTYQCQITVRSFNSDVIVMLDEEHKNLCTFTTRNLCGSKFGASLHALLNPQSKKTIVNKMISDNHEYSKVALRSPALLLAWMFMNPLSSRSALGV